MSTETTANTPRESTESATIQVPSQDFWTITPFTISTPDGWTARQTVDQLVYMSADGEPSTNCGVQWKRMSRDVGLQQIGGMAWAVTKKIDPEATMKFSKFVRVNGVTAYLRLAEYRRPADADGERALAGQMYAALHGPDFGPGRPIELFEIIGHFEATDQGRSADLEAILGSFQFLSIARAASAGDDSIVKGA